MSGFDAAWLALREPADHAARAPEIADEVRRHFAARAALTIVDLGCGTGSNLRALAGILPQRQRWHLIDGDAELLQAARHRLGDWADRCRDSADGIVLEKDGREIEVRFERADLRIRDLDFGAIGADLVTAAALLDLVSQAWLERLVAGLAARATPIYAVLSYDGSAHWHPADPRDAPVVAAFNRHQRGDKGFGPALGPDGGATLARLCAGFGYTTWSDASPWRLTTADAALIAAVTDGFAQAAGEIDPTLNAGLADWAANAGGRTASIGHVDIFARR